MREVETTLLMLEQGQAVFSIHSIPPPHSAREGRQEHEPPYSQGRAGSLERASEPFGAPMLPSRRAR